MASHIICSHYMILPPSFLLLKVCLLWFFDTTSHLLSRQAEVTVQGFLSI